MPKFATTPRREAEALLQPLAVLEGLRVSSPCRADWSKMAGDERVRFCGDCKQHVYNLSAMTQAEALALIESLERAPCVRYYERADGTILFSDCAVTRSRRRRGRLRGAGAALAAGAGLAALAALPPADPAPPAAPTIVLGSVGYGLTGDESEDEPEDESEDEPEDEPEDASLGMTQGALSFDLPISR